MSTMNTNGHNANKKYVSVLGLAPMQAPNSLGLTPYSPLRRDITREEMRAIEEFHREELIIDLTAEKGKLGMRKIAEVHECASDLFAPTVAYMLQNKEDMRGTEAYPYVEEFTLRQVQMYAKHLLGTLDMVDTNIAMLVHESLNLPPEQQGFWQRLLSGG